MTVLRHLPGHQRLCVREAHRGPMRPLRPPAEPGSLEKGMGGGRQGPALASHGGGCARAIDFPRARRDSREWRYLRPANTAGLSTARSSGGSRSGQPANCSAPIKRPPRSLQKRVALRNTRVHAAWFPLGSGRHARDCPRTPPHASRRTEKGRNPAEARALRQLLRGRVRNLDCRPRRAMYTSPPVQRAKAHDR